jgi:hypothetical protein
VGKRKAEWQDVNKVLGMFNRKVYLARKQYHDFAVKGIAMGRRPDLIGGGLIRSAGGWQALKVLGRNKIHLKGDERILGDSDFVLEVLNQQNELMDQRFRLREQGYDIEKVIERVSDMFSLSKQDIIKPGRQRQRVMARSVLCYWANRELGISGSELSQRLGLGQSSISRAIGRGEKLVNDRKLRLI